jgi:hypothetical protein
METKQSRQDHTSSTDEEDYYFRISTRERPSEIHQQYFGQKEDQ